MRKLLEAKNLSYSIGNKNILTNISLDIHDNNIYTIIGENGAGKSTLLLILSGLLEPTHGMIFRNYYSTILINENSILYNNLTGLENLNYYRICAGCQKSIIHDVIRQFNLKEFIDTKAVNLSLGQRKKLSVAVSMIQNNDLVIFDEMTTGLDRQNLVEIKQLIADLKYKYNKAVIFTTHVLDEVTELSDHTFILNQGRIMDEISVENSSSMKIYKFKTSSSARSFEALEKTGSSIKVIDEFIIEVSIAKKENISGLIKILVANEIDIIDIREENYINLFYDNLQYSSGRTL